MFSSELDELRRKSLVEAIDVVFRHLSPVHLQKIWVLIYLQVSFFIHRGEVKPHAPISEILAKTLKKSYAQKITAQFILDSWPEVVGEYIARKPKPLP